MASVRKIPMRKCVGCGEMTTEDQVILDATGRKNGRGAYLCFNKECLKKAVKNKGLERSLKMEIPQTIYENLEKEFEELENT